jgi:hypothetical protein
MAERNTKDGGADYEEGTTYCSLVAQPAPEFRPGFGPVRAESIIVLRNKWANGTNLHYYFFDQNTDGRNVLLQDGSREFRTWTADEDEKDLVRTAFQHWKDLGIGLTFEEVANRNDAEIRIGFERRDGYWSLLGRDVLGRSANKRTMNFGRNLTTVPDGLDTALHEIGHTLGLPHEHQSPFAGIEWNDEVVYAALAKPPNRWNRQKTFFNIIRKIQADEVQGSQWDRNSIMHYPFEAGLIDEPEDLRTGLKPEAGLSQRDGVWIRTYYPPIAENNDIELRPFEPQFLSILPGEQLNFVVRPSSSRRYTFCTFGESDTIAVLFEEMDGTPVYVTADDDSAQDRNAEIQIRLHKGRKYILRIRLYSRNSSGDTAVMMW